MTNTAATLGIGRQATLGGLVAILLWSLTIAVARSLSEQVGAVTAAAAAYSVSAAGCLVALARDQRLRVAVLALPRHYLLGCGGLFVANMVSLFGAVGQAASREQAIEVGLVNYLWPTLTVCLTVLVLRRRPSWVFLPGTVLAAGGVLLVLTCGSEVSWATVRANLASNPVAYLFAFSAAVSWALYSALTQRWAGGFQVGGVWLFLPATAMALWLLGAVVDEPRAWTTRAGIEVAALGLATYVAYGLWDTAMRRGNTMLVAVSSYFTPLFSTMVSSFYLAVTPGPRLWAGCLILVAGSLLSWLSVRQPPADQRNIRNAAQ